MSDSAAPYPPLRVGVVDVYVVRPDPAGWDAWRVLVLQRAPAGTRCPLAWEAVHGRIEPGEDPRYEPVFVGATADLTKAFDGHPRTDCFQMYLANVVAVLKEPDAAARERISQDLVQSLAPPCNAADAEKL